MTVDANVLNEIQYHVIEAPNNGIAMTTELWTLSEIINYLNDRTRRFIAETTLDVAVGALATTIGISRYDLSTIDPDIVDIKRAAWIDENSYSYELQRTDKYAWDMLIPAWEFSPDIPTGYSIATEPTRMMDLIPAPLADGQIQLLYTKLGAALSNTGISFTVADEFVPFIKWGTLADMLKKDGRASDPVRASYCEEKYAEGIMLANFFVGGF